MFCREIKCVRTEGVKIYWRYLRRHTESIEVSKGCRINRLLQQLPRPHNKHSLLVICVTSIMYKRLLDQIGQISFIIIQPLLQSAIMGGLYQSQNS